MVVIVLLSLLSFSGFDTGDLNFPFADKITHFFFYFVFAILGCLFLRERTKGNMELRKAITIIGFVAFFYGILIEGLQYTMTEDRMAELADVVANTVGAIVGVALIWWYFSKERPLKWKF